MCTWKKKKSQVKPYTYTFVVNKEAGAVKLTGSIQLTLKKKEKLIIIKNTFGAIGMY